MPGSLWLVQALAATGRTAAAHELFTELRALASPLGLCGEEIDPAGPPPRWQLPASPHRRLAAASRPPRALTKTVHEIAGSAWV